MSAPHVVAALRAGYAKDGVAFITENRVEQLFSAIAARDLRQRRMATVTSAVAHDLNCDLMIIAMACELARESGASMPVRDALNDAMAAAQRCIFRISDVLTWSECLGAQKVAAPCEALLDRELEEVRDRCVF